LLRKIFVTVILILISSFLLFAFDAVTGATDFPDDKTSGNTNNNYSNNPSNNAKKDDPKKKTDPVKKQEEKQVVKKDETKVVKKDELKNDEKAKSADMPDAVTGATEYPYDTTPKDKYAETKNETNLVKETDLKKPDQVIKEDKALQKDEVILSDNIKGNEIKNDEIDAVTGSTVYPEKTVVFKESVKDSVKDNKQEKKKIGDIKTDTNEISELNKDSITIPPDLSDPASPDRTKSNPLIVGDGLDEYFFAFLKPSINKNLIVDTLSIDSSSIDSSSDNKIIDKIDDTKIASGKEDNISEITTGDKKKDDSHKAEERLSQNIDKDKDPKITIGPDMETDKSDTVKSSGEIETKKPELTKSEGGVVKPDISGKVAEPEFVYEDEPVVVRQDKKTDEPIKTEVEKEIIIDVSTIDVSTMKQTELERAKVDQVVIGVAKPKHETPKKESVQSEVEPETKKSDKPRTVMFGESVKLPETNKSSIVGNIEKGYYIETDRVVVNKYTQPDYIPLSRLDFDYALPILSYNKNGTVIPASRVSVSREVTDRVVSDAIKQYHTGNYRLAKQLFSKLVHYNSDIEQSYYYLSRISYLDRDYGVAIEYLLSSYDIGLKNNSPAVQLAEKLFQCGIISLDIGKYENAADYFKRAIEVDPLQVKFKTSLGLAYYRTNDLKKAELLFSEAAKQGDMTALRYLNSLKKQ